MSGIARLTLLLAFLALIAGAAGLLRKARDDARRVAWSSSEAAFWTLVGADGRALPDPGPDGTGLPIPDGAAVRLVEDLGPCNRLERLTLQVQPGGPDASLELALGDEERSVLRVQVRPGHPPQAVVATSGGDAAPIALEPDDWTPGRSLQLQLVVQERSARLTLNGQDVGASIDVGDARGTLSIGARGGPLRLLRFGMAGPRTTEPGDLVRVSSQARWLPPTDAQLWRAMLATLGWILAALLAIAAWLRALCRGRPAPRSWAAATLLLAGAAALPACRLLVPPGGAPLPDPRELIGPSCLLALLALPFALRRMGPALRLAAPRGRLATTRALGWALLLAGAVALLVARQHWLVVQPRRVLEAEASALPSPSDFAAPQRTQLDASNALVVPGAWRNLELRASVTLAPGAALGVRVRAPDTDAARGLLLLLSSDERLATGFVREDTLVFDPLGPRGAAQPAGRALPLRLLLADRELSAFVGDTPIASATDDQFPSGGLVLLAERGTVEVEGLAVAARPATELSAPTAAAEWREWIVPALLPPLALLGFAWLAARLLRLPWLDVLEPAAFACVPFLLVWIGWRQGELLPSEALRWSALASVVLLFLVPVIHAARGAAARACGVLALALVGVPLTQRVTLGPELVLDDLEAGRARFAQWSGARQEDELLYLTHPRFRLNDGWLARHALRSGEHALARPAGGQRVLCLGGSCVWGYRLPPDQGLEFPARLGELLSEAGADGAPPVEVLNGACINAPSFVLLRLFRDGLSAYDPDVVVLSLYLADAYALGQADEEAYYEAITVPGFSRGWAFDLRTVLALRPARERFDAMLERVGAPDPGPDAAPSAGAAADLPGSLPPPERFAAELRSAVALCRQRGIGLVLVKEPLADDPPRLWKDEFYAAMDAVGQQAGVPVIDPRADLAAAGGRHLFLDDVHPSAAGHVVIARAIAPAVRELLAARRAAAGDAAPPADQR